MHKTRSWRTAWCVAIAMPMTAGPESAGAHFVREIPWAGKALAEDRYAHAYEVL